MVEKLFGELRAGWRYLSLGEVCLLGGGNVQTGPFGSQLHASDYVVDGIPSIMPANIGDNRIIPNGIARIRSSDAERLSKYRVRIGDIVYSRRGDVERRSLIRKDEDGWLCGTGCLRVRFGNGIVSPEYASHYLGAPAVKEWIVRHAHGATMPNLNTSILSACPFVLPPLSDQKSIAHVLEGLEGKIELNRQMNETLEAIARAIFKDWFVDFGPTRAKMAGIKPYLAPEIWNLFPDRLDDESTPNGWNVPKFEELVHAKQGKYLAKEEMTEVGSPDFPYPAWGGNGILGYSRKFDYDIPINLITCRGSNCGLIRLTESKASVSNNAFACRPRFGSTYFLHIYFLLESFSDCISGSAQPQITYTALRSKRMRFAVEQKMVERFSLLVEPLFQKILANKNEMENLAQIRDLLLPKLMSGEIRVRDAKSTSEAVTAMAS